MNCSRGTKRTRPPSGGVDSPRDATNEEDDVDLPLSKRINRLNIDYSKSNEESNVCDFKDKYPYEPSSTYYRTNELLYNLHEEKSQRKQQAALHKALNSHLKL